MTERIRDTEPVQVNKKIKAKVAKKLAGTKITIGKFYDSAVEEKLLKKVKPLAVLLIVLSALFSCTPKLQQGRYTYKKIKKSGYDCKPFKGRQFIRATNDSSKVNIVKL